jgi:hypothetical protein
VDVGRINKKMGATPVPSYLSGISREEVMENGEPGDKIIFFPLQPPSFGMI